MADKLEFHIGLVDDSVTTTARAAAAALDNLQGELETSKTQLAHFQAQLSMAKELGDVEGYRKYSKLVADARLETYTLGMALHAIEPGGLAAKKHLDEVAAANARLQASVAGVSTHVSTFTEDLAELGATAGPVAAAVLSAATAIGGALASLLIKAVETAIEVTDANERLIASFDALGGAGAGRETLKFLNELSAELPQSRDQLAKWAKSFEAMGITDLGALRGEIRATAAAQAIMGDEGAAAYEMLTRKVQVAIEEHKGLKLPEKGLTNLYKAGINVTDMATRLGMSTTELAAKLKAGSVDAEKFGEAMRATLEAKGARPLEDLSNDLDTLKRKGLEAFHHLFDNIDTSPISDAFKSIVELGNLGEPSGAALAGGIRSGIQIVIDYMGQMLTEGQIVFLELELYAMRHKKSLALVAEGFSQVAHSILLATNALEALITFADQPPPKWLQMLLSPGSFIGAAASAPSAPAHAEGGLVSKPAPGEYFASVAPGEMIIPKEIVGAGIGPRGKEMVAANTNGQPGGVQINTLHLTIEAPNGVTDATSLSATGLALALERMQLASGR